MRETAQSEDAEPMGEDTSGPALVNKEWLQFEVLLSDLSARFVNIVPDQVDREIERALEQILDFLQVDRCGLLGISPDRKRVHVTHAAYAEGVERVSGDIELASLFPWTYERVVVQGQSIRIERLEELPESAGQDRVNCTAVGIRSYLIIPLFFEGNVSSLIVIQAVFKERSWPEEYMPRLRLLGQIFVNAVEQRRRTQQLEERLRFETLLADISSRFLNVTAGEVDREIENAQRRICESLDLDLLAVWQLSKDAPVVLTATHYYRVQQGPQPPGLLKEEEFPWFMKQIEAGGIVAVSSLDEMPEEAAHDREVCRQFGVKSNLSLPLSVGGGPLIGMLGLNTTRTEREWPDALVKQLQLIAQVFANALGRKRSEEALRESEARLSLASDSAEMGLWILDIPSGLFWATPRALELFKFPPNEALTFDRFLRAVHAEDRDKIQRTVDDARNSRKDFSVEYRAVLPNGSVRWILSRGRPRVQEDGGVKHLMGVSVDITDRKRMEQELQERLSEIERMKLQLEEENVCLREELRYGQELGNIVGSSDTLQYVLFRVGQVAPTDSTVLILGETGTGKGMVANAIHSLSRRSDRPMITVNCAALPANLVESELFGREKGAFTGAHIRQAGRFEVADGGTIFLDEIGELPLELQSKLLRVLQEGEFERLGSAKTVKVDVRVIASTSRDLKEEMQADRFREDLYYRLNVFPVSLPPLRKRVEDIPELVRFFVDKYSRKIGRRIETIPKAAMKALQEYPWPGNVRELEHVIERAIITTPGTVLQLADRLEPLRIAEDGDTSSKELAAVEREHIVQVLRETGWKIQGPKGAASVLNLHPSTLRFRIKKLGIQRP